jgi:hypothetical protein
MRIIPLLHFLYPAFTKRKAANETGDEPQYDLRTCCKPKTCKNPTVVMGMGMGMNKTQTYQYGH